MQLSSEWAAQRKQFGQPIGKFQAVSFKLADMALGLRAADLLVKDAVKKSGEKYHEGRRCSNGKTFLF